MKSKIRIASIIVTYNRVSEAKAQMDIIRKLWQPNFENIDIYHEFNGKKKWYPNKYSEDFLHRHKSMYYLSGANYLVNQGFKHVFESGKKYDLIIVTSADAWFYDPKKLNNLVNTMHEKKFELATSLWGMVVLGTEFFIIKPSLAKKVFPLRLTNILKQKRVLKWAHKIAVFESVFTLKVMRVLKNPNKIYLIPGRKTVWTKNRYNSPGFYASHHDPIQRKIDIEVKIKSISGRKIDKMPGLSKFLTP